MDFSSVKLRKTEVKERKSEPSVVLCANSEDYSRLMHETYIEQYITTFYPLCPHLLYSYPPLMDIIYRCHKTLDISKSVCTTFRWCDKSNHWVSPWILERYSEEGSGRHLVLFTVDKKFTLDPSTRNKFREDKHLGDLAAEINKARDELVYPPPPPPHTFPHFLLMIINTRELKRFSSDCPLVHPKMLLSQSQLFHKCLKVSLWKWKKKMQR